MSNQVSNSTFSDTAVYFFEIAVGKDTGAVQETYNTRERRRVKSTQSVQEILQGMEAHRTHRRPLRTPGRKMEARRHHRHSDASAKYSDSFEVSPGAR